MNINCKQSEILYRYERHYKKNNVAGSKYLIIKRECTRAPLGLFAYYITNAAWIEYALRNDMIPVIDMKNFYNAYHEEGQVGKINTYEYFFKQPCGISLEEALQSKQSRYVWKDVPDFHPNESLDFFENTELLEYYRAIARKYMPFQHEIQEILEAERVRILGSERVLGVLARGTDYTSLKPYFHPVQPTVEELIVKIDQYLLKYNCTKIFVATEDSAILEKMKKYYGDNLLFIDQKRIEQTSTYLNKNEEIMAVNPITRGIDYLKAIYCLAGCKGLIAGRTSGTVGAMLLAQQYEFHYIFAKGRYGIESEILENRVRV